MKKIILWGFLLVFGTVFAEPELRLHYSFNEITGLVSDSSGNGLDAFCQQQGLGEVALTPAPGVSGLADDYAYNGSSADIMGKASRGAGACRVMYGGGGFDNDYESFTICGWFKSEGAVPFSNNARLLTMVGTENISLFDALGGGLRLQIGKKYVESGGEAYTTAGEWVFFAVTYDGTVDDQDNVAFWEGDKEGLKLVRSTKIDKDGEWKGLGPTGIISIGNRHGSMQGKHMNRPFDGYMDDFRIYVSENDADGALSESELDIIRTDVLKK